jgi:hypothetical protein
MADLIQPADRIFVTSESAAAEGAIFTVRQQERCLMLSVRGSTAALDALE